MSIWIAWVQRNEEFKRDDGLTRRPVSRSVSRRISDWATSRLVKYLYARNLLGDCLVDVSPLVLISEFVIEFQAGACQKSRDRLTGRFARHSPII